MRFRPSEEELLATGPDIVDRWTSFYADAPDKAMLWLGVISMYVPFRLSLFIANLSSQSRYVGPEIPPAEHKCYSMMGYLMYPVGVGSVHITSAEDVESPPDFDTGVLSWYVWN